MTDNDDEQIYGKRYRVVKKLGAGNFGTAYLVTDLKARNEPKVLKVVRLGEMDSDQSVESVREAQLLSQLNNPYIVKFHESFLDRESLCIVTEYCEGGDLDQKFKELKKKQQSLDEEQVVEWLIQILIAVQYMHKSRILHRDLKARNIFLKSNQVKIGDFGISRILVGTMDVANTFTGTPYYMSPEVMKHDGYESKSDIWSVGCLLYEMCTYQHAFDGKGLMNVIYKVVEGQPPELPSTYSKELNDLLKKMFTKEPNQRPSAVELLQSPLILQHRSRIKINEPLENTVNAQRRLHELKSRFQNSINFGEMQRQSWSLTNEGDAIEDSRNNDDDDDDVQNGNNTFYVRNVNLKVEDDDDDVNYQQSTLKAEQTQKTARQTISERKQNQADLRAQTLIQATRSNIHESAQHRQLMRESVMGGSLKQPWPSSHNTQIKEQTQPKLSRTINARPQYANQFSNDETFTVRQSKTVRNFNDDRPITPMRTTYRQIADRFGDEDGLPTDPNLTNQYYAAYDDFEKEDDQSPTRDKLEKEVHDQVCRSFSDHDGSFRNSRAMSASTRSTTINSLSRTIDPHKPTNPVRQSQYVPASQTVISNARRARHAAKSAADENTIILKDNPNTDAFGPMAKNRKITSLRTTAIKSLGESTFEKVHDYLVQQRKLQRTDPTLEDSTITQGLKSLVPKLSDGFLVDQLVFLELFS